jgi:hypothetical protein
MEKKDATTLRKQKTQVPLHLAGKVYAKSRIRGARMRSGYHCREIDLHLLYRDQYES